MSRYRDLLRMREDLDRDIAVARKQAEAEAISRIKQIVFEYRLTQEDIFPAATKGNRAINARVRKVATPQYRDPMTGKVWTGRGKPPSWIRDKDRSLFAI